MNWGPLIIGDEVRLFDWMKLETENAENDGYSIRKINAISLVMKINRLKLVNMCRYKNLQLSGKISRKYA